MQFSAEQSGCGEKPVKFFLAVPQHLVVRNDLRNLQTKAEVFGRSLRPSVNHAVTGHAIERAVHFDDAKSLGVLAQIITGFRPRRIERSDPVVVTPTTASDRYAARGWLWLLGRRILGGED